MLESGLFLFTEGLISEKGFSKGNSQTEFPEEVWYPLLETLRSKAHKQARLETKTYSTNSLHIRA